VYVASGQPGGSTERLGPQFGSLSVFARQSPPTLSLAKPRAGSAGIRAGRVFSISIRVTTSIASVRVSCSAKVGVQAVRTRARLRAGELTCSGVVPRGSAGKRLTGAIGAAAEELTRTTTFSFPVAR
jgi:hypothetical protein